MKLKHILKAIRSISFDSIAKSLESDYKVKKLTSKTMFMVILHSMFSERNFSLRKLKENFNNKIFQKKILGNENLTTIDHTAFHYRLQKINYKFFEQIFKSLFKECTKMLGEEASKYDILRIDSTLVDVSSKIINNIGFNQSGNQVKSRKIKYSMAYGELPERVDIFERITHKSENIALKEAILSKEIPRNKILVFDRGLSNRETFDKISKNNYFVSRLTPGYKVKIEKEEVKENKEEERENKKETKDQKKIIITKVIRGRLYGEKNKKTEEVYTIIHAKSKNVYWDKKKETSLRRKIKSKKNAGKTKEEVKKEMLEEEIVFVTNIDESLLSAEEIAEIYKYRWEIEVLFRFLKQELHFSHLINNSINGIRVMVYMTLIFSLLLLIYKKKNNLKGYKYTKYKMLLELREEFCKYVVIISGGSLQKWENSSATFW